MFYRSRLAHLPNRFCCGWCAARFLPEMWRDESLYPTAIAVPPRSLLFAARLLLKMFLYSPIKCTMQEVFQKYLAVITSWDCFDEERAEGIIYMARKMKQKGLSIKDISNRLRCLRIQQTTSDKIFISYFNQACTIEWKYFGWKRKILKLKTVNRYIKR